MLSALGLWPLEAFRARPSVQQTPWVSPEPSVSLSVPSVRTSHASLGSRETHVTPLLGFQIFPPEVTQAMKLEQLLNLLEQMGIIKETA